MKSLLLNNAQLVYANGAIVHGGLRAVDGIIVEVFEGAGPPRARGEEVIDGHGNFVLPGLIDPHVQLPTSDDGAPYGSETKSAAVGGVTTIIKMHRDLAGYDTSSSPAEIEVAESRACVDFSYHIAVMTNEQIEAIPELARRFSSNSFKFFTAYKGEEGYQIGIQGIDDGQLLDAFRAVAAVSGVALVHCENQELAARALRAARSAGRDDLRAWADSRPSIVEAEAVRRVAYLAASAECQLYVVHVSARQSLEYLVPFKRAGGRVYIETEAHYLTETADSPAGVLAKIIPPVREETDKEALWEAVTAGDLDTIGSDHVLVRKDAKLGSVWDARLAFPGIATILPVMLSEGYWKRGVPLWRLVQLTSTNAARIFGLSRKGMLLPGMDADFVVIDVEVEKCVEAPMLSSASDFSIYEGRVLRGWPVLTVCRGNVVARNGEFVGDEGYGRYVARRPAGVELSA